MHDTAMAFGRKFFETYVRNKSDLVIIDIGSQDVNGSLRTVAPLNNKYIGVDFVEGKGVDVVISDPYVLPFADNTADVLVCSSCFEHSEFFWLLYLEMLRILKPTGVFYLNVPSNGSFHRYPVDCWRFYPDSGLALQKWARHSNYQSVLLESFIGDQRNDGWNDFIAVFLKDEQYVNMYEKRMIDSISNYTNGHILGSDELQRSSGRQEDQDVLKKLRNLLMKVYWLFD